MERKFSKGDFQIVIDGAWIEIYGKYGLLEAKEIKEDISAEKLLEEYILAHKVADFEDYDIVKRVIYDVISQGYQQVQLVYSEEKEFWIAQIFDDELAYIKEIWSLCKDKYEAIEWLKRQFNVQTGLPAEVYRCALGDGTNKGISANQDRLYLITRETFPFEPQDIRQCVKAECLENYIRAKPLYKSNRWHMMGGNFIYTTDSRYQEITGASYPIPIHDRCEG